MIEKELFDVWRKKWNAKFFVEDGVINKNLFDKSKTKIMMLLKETPFDNSAPSGYNIVKAINEGITERTDKAVHDMFMHLTRQLYAINKTAERKAPNNFHGVEGKKIKNSEYSQYLQSSAYVNIKKFEGEKKSDEKVLRNIAMEDRELLKIQIDEFIKPKVVWCGSTYPIYKVIYEEDKFEKIDDTLFFFHRNSQIERLVFAGYHPKQTTYTQEKIYTSLIFQLENINVKKWLTEL